MIDWTMPMIAATSTLQTANRFGMRGALTCPSPRRTRPRNPGSRRRPRACSLKEDRGRRHRAEHRAADLHAIRPVIPVADDVEEGLPAGVLRLRVAFALRAPRRLHAVRPRLRHLLQGLSNDVARFPELVEADHEPRVRVADAAVLPNLRFEFYLLVGLVRVEPP